MFSKNGYLLQQGSPSSSLAHASNSVVNINSNEIMFQHHLNMFPAHYLAATNGPFVDEPVFFSQDVAGLNGDPSVMVDSCPRAAKKDRHSKIYTAQGPRDRRVRLNMGVARRFFDLQEILGFDKPSKTLDWLLTKSKTAIKDLVQSKGNTSKSVSSPSECEVYSSEAVQNGEFLGTDSKRKLVLINSDKQKAAAKDSKKALNLAKESRAKARARAKERTREKMCIKQFNETRLNGYDFNPSIPIHFMNDQHEICKISGSTSSNSSYTEANSVIRQAMLHCHPTYEATNEDLIQESILIKRKVKQPSILGFQQNLILSSSNYGASYPYSATENWDINNFSSQSNICAILDQQKFMNSTSNN